MPGLSSCRKISSAAHAIEELRRRRNEGGSTRPRSAYPVLAFTELSRLLFAPATFGQEHSMDLANEPRRERKTAEQPVETMIESRDVV
jgi:hypothetical protein